VNESELKMRIIYICMYEESARSTVEGPEDTCKG